MKVIKEERVKAIAWAVVNDTAPIEDVNSWCWIFSDKKVAKRRLKALWKDCEYKVVEVEIHYKLPSVRKE